MNLSIINYLKNTKSILRTNRTKHFSFLGLTAFGILVVMCKVSAMEWDMGNDATNAGETSKSLTYPRPVDSRDVSSWDCKPEGRQGGTSNSIIYPQPTEQTEMIFWDCQPQRQEGPDS